MQSGFIIFSLLVIAVVFLSVFLLVVWQKYRVVKKELNQSRMAHSHVQALVDSIPDLTWVKDKDSRFLMVNRQFSRVFNSSVEQLLGKTDADLSDADTASKYLADDQWVLDKREVLHREERISSPAGGETWAETVKVPVFNRDGDVIGTAGIARDISERKRAEKQIQHLAHHDALTGLPNRVLLELLVNQQLQKHRTQQDPMTLVFIDLDNFKIINDTISHKIGDLVLKALAQRLRHVVGEKGSVARIGGDEFVLVLPFTNTQQASELLQAAETFLSEPLKVENLVFDLTMSAGLACYPQDGEDCWSLVQNADLAKYHAKQSGKNQSVIFSQQLALRSIHNMTRDSRMKEALDNGEFTLFYQPKVDADSGQIIGLEALMRWQDRATQEWIKPCDFIPAAERSGFILKLGDWLMHTVVQQVAQWRQSGIEIPVAINISAVQIHQNRIGQKLKQYLEQYDVPGHLLELELTESVLMEHSDKIIARLEEIRDLGVAISIDDFGTGYSNLAYLSRFPLSRLKIDRVFVDNIQSQHNHFQVARAIMDLAKGMKLKVVAEGIETQEELSVLLGMGVDELQGYLFDKPLPADKLLPLLQTKLAYLDRFPLKKRSANV
ncbi:Cyclic di-GMP phosphodiesterase Gmr [Thalassocella blandensis]|nr:Cyclic di-GMP phosphodiesterase Gmr [Thalassocella blandensis]